MTYPYVEGDLIEHRQSYAYAPYEGPGFLDDWRRSRLKARGLLPAPARITGSDPITYPSEAMFAELRRCVRQGAAAPGLDQILRHFEVSKRVFGDYGDDHRPVDPSDYRNLAPYVAWCELLDEVYAHRGTLTYLNALLKCLDTLVAMAGDLGVAEGARIARLLDREALHVDTLQRRMQG